MELRPLCNAGACCCEATACSWEATACSWEVVGRLGDGARWCEVPAKPLSRWRTHYKDGASKRVVKKGRDGGASADERRRVRMQRVHVSVRVAGRLGAANGERQRRTHTKAWTLWTS